ncbi:MAG: transmembrane BlaR protein, partial [Rhodanobacter sp.]
MSIDHVVISLLARLGWTSLQAVILIGLLALLVHLLPRLSAAMRCTLWWLVGAQLLAGMVWHAPLQLRLLSPPAVERTLDAAVVSTPAPANLLVNATASVAAAPHENRAPTPASPAAPRWL